MAKIACAVNYFRRQERPEELFVSFIRKSLQQFPDWENLANALSRVDFIEQEYGTEDFRDKLMIDFANKYIGGGSLSTGTVQEEIIFHKHVEPIVSMLFTEQLENEEAFIIKGVQRFNETRGFKSSFRLVGDFLESIVQDDFRRNDSYIVAIDAVYYQGHEYLQYEKAQIVRELNKAYVGFMGDAEDRVNRDIATGRWGCGAFGGDDRLKFVIQWLAASAAGKNMQFLPWDMKGVQEVKQFVQVVSGFPVWKVFNATVRNGRSNNLLAGIIHILKSMN